MQLETTTLVVQTSCRELRLLSPLLWNVVARFLDIRSLLNMKNVSHAFRSVVNLSTRADAVPFAFMFPPTRKVVVGRYFLPTNTVALLGLTDEVPIRIRLGKARVQEVMQNDDAEVARKIKEILDCSPDAVEIEYDDSRDSEGLILETMRYVRQCSPEKKQHQRFFFFTDSVFRYVCPSVSQVLQAQVEEVELCEDEYLSTEPLPYKLNSTLIVGDFSMLQRSIHRRLSSILAPCHGVVPAVKGYTPTDPSLGAVRMTPEQAVVKVGHMAVPMAPAQRSELGLPNTEIADVSQLDTGIVLSLDGAAVTLPISHEESAALRTLFLGTVVVMTTAVSGKGGWPTPDPCLFCGTLASGTDVVTSAREAEAYFQQQSLQPGTQNSSRALYIADNAYLSEVFHAYWYAPTSFLQNVLHGRGSSGIAVESGSTSLSTATVRGRPLDTPWILWGSNGSYSSEHTEPHDSCVWVHLFDGLKRWHVFDERFQKWLSFLQRSGQTVFMPRRTRHVVENLSSGTFAVARNYLVAGV